MPTSHLRQRVFSAIDARADEIVALGERIRKNPALAYVGPAKALAGMVIDLLADGARGAREVLAAAKPRMTREAYLAFQRAIWKREMWEGQ